MQTLAPLVSVALGEIRLSDLRRQTDFSEVNSFPVLALDHRGLPTELTLSLAPKWCTNGFVLQLGCPGCRRPCRILRDGPLGFLCGRCSRVRTQRRRRRNNRERAIAGAPETDEVIRATLSPGARELTQRGAALASVLRDQAAQATAQADAILAILDTMETEHAF